MSDDTTNTKPGSSDDADDEEQAGAFVNEITPTNTPEPAHDPSWTHDDKEEGSEPRKAEQN